ncbi:hypothetical protein LCGC14_1447260 [marine sediment metagenome]|uniref:Transposase zinc-binding domain-containing protein n=1 Tax=marine sediment metagenome TaxID=412755 RepID=A0A0F9LZE5_9ZZZZ
MPVYVPKEQNVIQEILQDHFSDFEEQYDDHYAKQYGKYRIIRIKEAVEKFLECGDYSKGIARIKCTNHNCDHEYFRPFSCKTWYLCPSCHQKRILLFSEHMANDVLLRLPHRQYVWAYLKHFVSTSEMMHIPEQNCHLTVFKLPPFRVQSCHHSGRKVATF